MRRAKSVVFLVVVAGLVGCSARPAQPVAIDPADDTCAECRMLVSDVRLAAQIVAPGEEPRVFDEIGCLRNYLRAKPIARDAAVYVADHRTGAWLAAGAALYTRTSLTATPMGSGILAHADASSRDRDAMTASGQPVPVTDILTPAQSIWGTR